MAKISSGGFTANNITNYFKKFKSLAAVVSKVDDLAALCYSLPAHCINNIVHYEAFVVKNLSYLQSVAGRLEIWKLGISAGNAGMRGNIIEHIFTLTKYKLAKNLNTIKNNFPGVDFDVVTALGKELISLKTFHVEPLNMVSLKSTLRQHTIALADANLPVLSQKAGYNLNGHSRTLEFVIKKGAYDLNEIKVYTGNLKVTVSKLSNINFVISEF